VPDLDLEQIKSRIEKAAAGPWTAHADGLVWAPRLGDPVVSASTELADADFIAAARTDVPKLVAEVERLLGAPFPTSDAYEHSMAALTDERAKTDALLALLAEVLDNFPTRPKDLMVRSGYVLEETLIRWRSHLRGEG
jgi:hypothetical protein